MAASKPTADDVIKAIKELIAREGKAVFETNGRVQLYSGPLSSIIEALDALELLETLGTINNRNRSIIQAKNTSTLIDDTPIGLFFNSYENGKNVYQYFDEIYGEFSPEAFHHADKVMRFVSRAFAKACYGSIETAICGASLNNIFFEVELPELILNERVETINAIPMQRIRDIYCTQGAYVAYREICRAELEVMRQKAKKEMTAEAKKDVWHRVKFFRMGMKEIFKKIRPKDRGLTQDVETMKKLGPIDVREKRNEAIRFMAPKSPYVACSVQYG